MQIGYARVSKLEQNLDRQIAKLQTVGCSIIFSEKISGTKDILPELEKCIGSMSSGDTLIVDEINRLGRNTIKLLQLIERLEKRSISLVILSLSIDTRTPIGKAFLTLFASLAQLERDTISERTKAALERIKAAGKPLGRPVKITLEHQEEMLTLYEKKIPVVDIAKQFNTHTRVAYKSISEARKRRPYAEIYRL
jgi:DNA invertase Pin-like site-specific DNA recombinase